MENAGAGATRVMQSLGVDGDVLIVAGKGNNGGDGFVIARHLELLGIRSRVVLLTDPAEVTGDAAANLSILRSSGTEVLAQPDGQVADACGQADWIVDAMLGTGTHGTVRAPFDTAIECVNEAKARVISIDLPSGLDCDTGMPLGPTIRANDTITFVAPKVGFANATAFVGEVHTVGIGAPRCVLEGYFQ